MCNSWRQEPSAGDRSDQCLCPGPLPTPPDLEERQQVEDLVLGQHRQHSLRHGRLLGGALAGDVLGRDARDVLRGQRVLYQVDAGVVGLDDRAGQHVAVLQVYDPDAVGSRSPRWTARGSAAAAFRPCTARPRSHRSGPIVTPCPPTRGTAVHWAFMNAFIPRDRVACSGSADTASASAAKSVIVHSVTAGRLAGRQQRRPSPVRRDDHVAVHHDPVAGERADERIDARLRRRGEPQHVHLALAASGRSSAWRAGSGPSSAAG